MINGAITVFLFTFLKFRRLKTGQYTEMLTTGEWHRPEIEKMLYSKQKYWLQKKVRHIFCLIMQIIAISKMMFTVESFEFVGANFRRVWSFAYSWERNFVNVSVFILYLIMHRYALVHYSNCWTYFSFKRLFKITRETGVSGEKTPRFLLKLWRNIFCTL